MRDTQKNWRFYALSAVFLLAAGGVAHGSSGGINGFSGNPATNGGLICTACHEGGLVPLVTLTGPQTVDAGMTNTYTLQIRGGQQGQGAGGGLDVSVDGGTLVDLSPDTQLLFGEITHRQPKPTDIFGNVTFTFDWTAPLTAGSYTMYGAGNSVNGTGDTNGDNANSAVLAITVTGGAAQTPGESSSETLSPLLVTDRDAATGNITVSYESACETTSNNIYYGPLADVSTFNWSGDECDIGTGGTHTFNPGSGSFFFVVVGTSGSDEGSYGKDGSLVERPDFPANACGQLQNLSDSCDVP